MSAAAGQESKQRRRSFLPPLPLPGPELNACAPKHTGVRWLVVAEGGGTSCRISSGDANEAVKVSQVFPEPLLKTTPTRGALSRVVFPSQHRASGLSRSRGIHDSCVGFFPPLASHFSQSVAYRVFLLRLLACQNAFLLAV